MRGPDAILNGLSKDADSSDGGCAPPPPLDAAVFDVEDATRSFSLGPANHALLTAQLGT